MFCKNCGAPLKDGARFCEECGTKIDIAPVEEPVAVPPTEVPEEAEAVAEPETATAVAATAEAATTEAEVAAAVDEASAESEALLKSPAPAVDLVRIFLRRSARSAWLWILIFALTLSVVSYYGILFPSRFTALSDTIEVFAESFTQNLYGEWGMDTDFVPGIASAVILPCMVLFSLPTVFILLGLWITAVSALSKKPRATSAGITLIRGVVLVLFVLFCIFLTLIFIPLLVGLIYSFLSAIPSLSTAMLIFMIAFIVIATPCILYYAFLLRTLRAIRYAFDTSLIDLHISRYVAVVYIISAVYALFAVIGTWLIPAFDLLYSKPWAIVSATSLLIADICVPVLLFTYRSKLKKIADTPVYRQFASEHTV